MDGESRQDPQIPKCDLCGKVIEDPDSALESGSAFEFEGAVIHTLCMANKVDDEDRNRITEVLEEKLEEIPVLKEDSRKAIEALLDIVVKNPDRVLRLERLYDQVESIESQLNSRTESLRREMETRLAGMDTRLYNSSLVVNVALAVGGFLAGVVVTLLLS
jgi:hypothetical protein